MRKIEKRDWNIVGTYRDRGRFRNENVDDGVSGHRSIGPCRVPDRWIEYPVPFCRFYYPNRKFYSNKFYSNKLWRDKQGRQEDLPLETAKHFVRYALLTKPLQRSRAFAIGFEIEFDFVRIGNFCAICLFSGTRMPDRYGNRVPGSKNIRKRTGLHRRSTVLKDRKSESSPKDRNAKTEVKRCYTKRAQLNDDDRGRRSTLVEMAATVVNENSMQREQRLKKKFIPFPPTEVLSLIAVKFKIFYLIRIISIVYIYDSD